MSNLVVFDSLIEDMTFQAVISSDYFDSFFSLERMMNIRGGPMDSDHIAHTLQNQLNSWHLVNGPGSSLT
jgi:hypothetical protein